MRRPGCRQHEQRRGNGNGPPGPLMLSGGPRCISREMTKTMTMTMTMTIYMKFRAMRVIRKSLQYLNTLHLAPPGERG